MADEKKKPGLAALVLGLGKSSADDGDGEDEESSEDFNEAAGEAFDAFEAKDKPAFVQALKACMSCK